MKTAGIILFLILHIVHGYPNGAPTTQESCYDLQPIHTDPITGQQYPNQEDPPPFRIEVSTGVYQPCVMPIDCRRAPITVTIRGLPINMYLRGFIIQARTQFGGAKAHGQFLRAPDGTSDGLVKPINCPNGQTLTHTSNRDLRSIRFQWIPEPNMKEPVQFVSTVVQTEQTIYADVRSTEITAAGVTQRKDKKAQRTNQFPSSIGVPSTNLGQPKMFILQESRHRPFDYSWQNQRPILSPSIQQQETVAISQLISPGVNNSPQNSAMQRNRQVTNGRQNNVVPNGQLRGASFNRQRFAQGINGVQNSQQIGTNVNTGQPAARTNNIAVNNVNTQVSTLQTNNIQNSNRNVRQPISNNNVLPNNRGPSIGLSTSQRLRKLSLNNNPMAINAAQQPINATSKRIFTGNNLQQLGIKPNPRTELVISEVNQQPKLIRPTQFSNTSNINPRGRSSINNGQNQTNRSGTMNNSRKFSTLGTTTTKRPSTTTMQRTTTLYISTVPITTKTPQVVISNTMARTNNIGSRALTRNNLATDLDTNDINKETKPRNSGFTYTISTILMIVPLFVIAI